MVSARKWQQHKQLKTMEMNETWLDIYDEENIYINLNLYFSQNSTEAVEAASLKISNHGTSLSWIIAICAMNRGIPIWVWRKANGNWNSNIKTSQWRKSHFRTNTMDSRKEEMWLFARFGTICTILKTWETPME